MSLKNHLGALQTHALNLPL